ncbi:MAG: D-tyrosyl-tRNA(Tyr) deacylase [Clostridia bacterium]|nr:D-tyrosyl-tRNA(Tyr) deacylase [Clostridia bacterium]
MRAVVQRVTHAEVSVNGNAVGRIGRGLMVLLGVRTGDTEKDAEYLAGKIVKLRIFEDENGKMNRSVREVQGGILCVSQFTLLGDARGQNRPGFTMAEAPERADELYRLVCLKMREMDVPVETGVFRADMQIEMCNDGPVTILLDSEKTF